MGAGPRGLCPGAEHRRRLGGDPARLRARPRRARRLGQCARARARGAGVSRPSRLRRRALRAPAGEDQHRPQARCGSRVSQPPGGHRRGCGQSRRPAADAEARLIPPASAGPRRGGGAARPDPGADPARGARPRDVRARLLVRTAGGGDRVGGPRRRRLRLGGRARHGQGAEDAPRADRRTGSARVATLPRGGASHARARPRGARAVRLAPRKTALALRRAAPPR